MAIFGLVTQRQHKAEIESLKAQFSRGITSEWLLATAAQEKYNLPDPSVYDNQARLYQRLSWVYAAVNAVANDAALVDFSVEKLMAGEESQDIVNHPFELLLNQPNPMDSRFEFLYATFAMRKLNGNAYWWLNRKSEFESPTEMWFVPPSHIRPLPDGKMYISGYEYNTGGGDPPFKLETWEVVHFRNFNPFSRFVGLSAIECLALVAAGDIGMQAWNTKLFAENNARLPGILAFKDYPADPVWDQIKLETREASKKRELMMLRGVGEGINWMQNAVSQKEMEFLSGREANKEEIWAVLAPGLAAMLDPNATEANARAGRATFNDRAVYPELVGVQEKVTLQILPSYGEQLRGEFEDIRYTDRALELQEQETYAKTHTVEEVRREYYKDEPLGDDRDKLFPIQINAQTGDGTKQEPPIPAPALFTGGNQNVPEEPVQQNSEAEKAELARWQRKALRKADAPFETAILPADTVREIRAKLAACKSADDVRQVFAAQLDQPVDTGREAAILKLAERINGLYA